MMRPSRHTLCAVAALLGLTAWANALPAAAPEARKPNVLFIAVDDLNDWVGCLGGHPQAKTPNIDRLARRGTLFTRAYCPAPACNPSRAALMTGVRPHTSGVYHNDQPWRPAVPDAVTLSQFFMKHGYHVSGAGKIFHGGFDEPESWHEYAKSRQERGGGGNLQPKEPGRAGGLTFGPLEATDEQMPDHRTVSWTVERLGKKQDKPFFLACGLHKPHLPFQAPKKYFDMHPLESVTLPKVPDDDLNDVPPAGVKMARPQGDQANVLKANAWKPLVQAYLACISYADAEIGRVLDALEAGPHKDNTIVVFWGDHGWHLGEKHHWRKFALWERATKVPMIVSVPGMTNPGSVCDRPVDMMSFYPTLAELCGLPAPQKVEGVSIRPLLEDPKAKWDHHALTTHGRGNHAIRTERWRYIRYADGSEELYDHDADPNEWKNLAGDPKHAEAKKELAARLPRSDAPDAKRREGAPARRQRGGRAGARE